MIMKYKQKNSSQPMLRWLAPVGVVLFLMLGACEDYPAIDLGTFDDQVYGEDPTILSISPPSDSAFAGYSVIRIQGQNFSPDSGGNVVYFSGVRAEILSYSATEIVVQAPDLVGSDLEIVVRVDGAMDLVRAPYQLATLSEEYGNFGNNEKVRCFAMDEQENLYAMLDDRTVVKVTPDGDRTTYGTTSSFPSAGEMRVGPGGALYIQRISNRTLYRIASEGDDATAFIEFVASAGGQSVKLTSFDFDEHGNIWAGGITGGLVVQNVNGNSYGQADYADGVKIKSVRVNDGYVYVGREDGVYRSLITSDSGTVANKELVIDWNNVGAMSASDLKSITFSADGTLYIGSANTQNTSLDPILAVQPDGTSEPLYPGQLILPADHLVWGGGQYLYVNRANRDGELRRIIKVNMLKEGAPYYGRGL